MKLALTAVLVAGCAAPAVTAPTTAAPGIRRVAPAPKHRPRQAHASRSQTREPIALDWPRVAACESGGDWHINTANGYEGGLQFAPSTWAAMGGREFAEHAYDATQAQQIEVAERLYRLRGTTPWPRCGVYLKPAA